MATTWKADPTFYPSPRMAAEAPRETVAYVAAFNAEGDDRPDALAVVDTDPDSGTYSQIVGWVDMPEAGDELHHFGWNACSSALCPYAPHPHLERRFLVVPGIRSSKIHIIDTKPDARQPRITKVIDAQELAAKTHYSRPHTVHCGPEGLYVSALGAATNGNGNGGDGHGPGGIALLDHDTFDVKGQWERDRGPQYYAYDFFWHLNHDVMISSEWGTPDMIENGVDAEALLGRRYGHALHVWDLRRRRHLETLELGDQYQMALELRPAHDPTKTYGFCGVVVNVEDLSGSVWLWHDTDKKWQVTKVIDIPAQPADAAQLPPLLAGFGAVPPLITDIDLSVDDRFLYVSCWGTGELLQYDVTDPFSPKQVGSVKLGGIVDQTPHPNAPDQPLNGGPQMLEVSRDGRRVYVTNSLYRAWDDQFYPAGLRPWMAKLDVGVDGGMTPDPRFFLQDFRGLRAHQVRLEGGDASSDSYCYP